MTNAITETRTRKVETLVPVVILEMDMEEAQALLDLSWRVGGNPRQSGRRHIDSIRQALLDAGVESGGNAFCVPGKPFDHATIHFKDKQ